MEKDSHFVRAEFDRQPCCGKAANADYHTGYDAYSSYIAQVVIALDHDEPIWIGRGMDRISATITTCLAEENNSHLACASI